MMVIVGKVRGRGNGDHGGGGSCVAFVIYKYKKLNTIQSIRLWQNLIYTLQPSQQLQPLQLLPIQQCNDRTTIK